jgi:phage terminase large subunit-like protein
MAFIQKQTLIDAPAGDVWDALRDWGALHERLVPGFVTDTRLDGQDRIVTFFNGTVLREVLVDCDEAAMRLAWTIVDGPYTHHNGVAQVFAEEPEQARFVWTADLLPDETAEQTAAMMEHGVGVVKRTLEAGAAEAPREQRAAS